TRRCPRSSLWRVALSTSAITSSGTALRPRRVLLSSRALRSSRAERSSSGAGFTAAISSSALSLLFFWRLALRLAFFSAAFSAGRAALQFFGGCCRALAPCDTGSADAALGVTEAVCVRLAGFALSWAIAFVSAGRGAGRGGGGAVGEGHAG